MLLERFRPPVQIRKAGRRRLAGLRWTTASRVWPTWSGIFFTALVDRRRSGRGRGRGRADRPEPDRLADGSLDQRQLAILIKELLENRLVE